jgi:probable HAF family extracellular repeat protein
MRKSLFTFAGLCLALLIDQAVFAQAYNVTDLGMLPGGTYSVAQGINAKGDVTGFGDTSTGAVHAFVFSNGTMQDLGTLPGGRNSGGSGINASGQVTGWSEINAPNNIHAFLFSNGVMQDLGTLPGDVGSSARAINDAGQVTGDSTNAAGRGHAVLYSKGIMSDLGTLPGFLSSSLGFGINNLGAVAGESYSGSGFTRAVIFGVGAISDLGSLPGSTQAAARAINDSGQVTGWAETIDGTYNVFLYQDGTMWDLVRDGGGPPVSGALYSVGQAINNLGEITGKFGFLAGSLAVDHAFLVRVGRGQPMQDLNDLIPPNSGWVLETGYGINNAGQIVGGGTLNGAVRAFLLTPVVADTTPPRITISATPTVLWPPNNKAVPVTVWGRITDDGSGVAAGSIEYAVTDEYGQLQPRGHLVINTNGKFAFQVLLRAFRAGDDLDGHQYVISVSAKDNAGNAETKSQTITVPHDHR